MSAVGLLMLADVVAATPPPTGTCDAQTEVVSETRCTRYGQMWAAERTFKLVLGTGFFMGSFDARGRSWTAKKTGNSGQTGTTYSGEALGIDSVRTYGLDFDLHGFVTEHTYLGLDIAFGVGRAGPKNSITGEGYVYAPTSGVDAVQVRMGGTIGFRIPTPYFSVRAESLVGVEIYSITHDATPVGGGSTERASSTAVSFLLEPRIAADIWTAPWATMSLWGGKNVTNLRDTSMGIMFALHGRTFDGGS